MGMTNVEIGHHLFISKRMVESHVEHIKQKLGLGSRARLMAWGLDPSIRSAVRRRVRAPLHC